MIKETRTLQLAEEKSGSFARTHRLEDTFSGDYDSPATVAQVIWLILTAASFCVNYPHFAGEETEIYRGLVTCSSSHSKLVAELRVFAGVSQTLGFSELQDIF